ncbi:MAG: hypothetical protein JJV97_06175 [SAR324 cluster bacterium]|nr:hypothetical protein [SAR324 cluster bacterium]
MANFETALTKLLVKEGGATISDHKHDRGGITKWGISKLAYQDLDIASLTYEQAKEIYKRDYWDKFKLDTQDSQKVAEVLFEAGVHMGVKTALRIFNSLKSQLNKEETIIVQFKLALAWRYARICMRNSTQRVFLLGWLKRIFS